jgi:hypothetical protein
MDGHGSPALGHSSWLPTQVLTEVDVALLNLSERTTELALVTTAHLKAQHGCASGFMKTDYQTNYT